MSKILVFIKYNYSFALTHITLKKYTLGNYPQQYDYLKTVYNYYLQVSRTLRVYTIMDVQQKHTVFYDYLE